jgi:hypothetical protein
MALDLSGNPLLEAAQDSQSRHPLIEIISQPSIADIPFNGQFLTTEIIDEQKPNVITHSSGRLCLIYSFGSIPALLKYVYTDEERMEFHFIDLSLPISRIPIEASICELANENKDIGIIYIATYGENYELRYRTISVVGAPGFDDTLIASYTSSNPIDSPFVIRLISGSFLLVYTKADDPDYFIIKRTVSDFEDWDDSEEFPITDGLDSTHKRYNTSLLQISTEDIFLWFDYVDETGPNGEELTNLYYLVSDDDGDTWDEAIGMDDPYTLYSTVGKHPIAVQKVTEEMDTMHLLFYEESTSIHMDGYTLGWCGETDHGVTDMHFDPVARKLYAVSTNTSGFATKMLRCVLEIDVDTWTINGDPGNHCWDFDSVPAFNHVYGENHIWWARHHGERNYTPVAITISNENATIASVLDAEADTITDYIFRDSPIEGLTKNVNIILGNYEGICYTWVDYDSRRFYVVFGGGDPYPYRTIRVGYLDLTEVGGPYTWTDIVIGYDPGAYEAFAFGQGDFLVVSGSSYIITSYGYDPGYEAHQYIGSLAIHMLTDGSVYKDYRYSTYPAFPYHGLHDCVFLNGKIYGSFIYESDFGQVDYRGLCEINLATDGIIFHRPSWATLDNYGLGRMTTTQDGKIIMACGPAGYPQYNGITIYNPEDDTWVLYTSDNLPGLTPNGADLFASLAYDDTQGMVFAGTPTNVTWDGITAFLASGYIKRGKYKTGLFSDGSWTFGETKDLVQGLIDYEVVAALDPSQSIYAFWTNSTEQELSIKWDKENSQFNIHPYLVMGSEVDVNRTVDGTPASISFEVSHGHLFDPHNSTSLWSIYLAKFRKLNLRFGEKVSGSPYWQQAGVFFVTENSVEYERPKYPMMKVKGEDRISMWEIANIIATDDYSTYPEDIMEDLLSAFADFIDTDIPVFDNRVKLYHQWVDMPLKEMLDQICERFGYYPRIDVDGKFSARKIRENAPIEETHIYSDLTKIINFSPDDSFSDWTNQVMVIGEGRDWLEVLYNEEPIESYTGTMGWWGKKTEIYCYYSKDGSRRCRYPRLEIIESVRDGPWYMKDGDEYLGEIDFYEKYVVIVVEGPDLIIHLVAEVVAWIALAIIAAELCASSSYYTAILCLAAKIAEIYVMYEIMCILGTQGGYQYNVYARPIGKVRQQFQAIANDADLQTLIGMEIQRKIEDPLCYALDQCQQVANFELMVCKSQRKRIKFSKMTNLQDEEGDTIQILHPYTHIAMNIFITDLIRKFKLPSSSDSNDGSFIDEIEGWKVG